MGKYHVSGSQFFIYQLSHGLAKIASGFYPHPVIVRLSDFKSNEYKNLLGGHLYEPEEENPMIGWRGASRYYSKDYEKAFELECEAIKYVRNIMKMTNVIVMIPFCRTPDECKKVLETMEKYGLVRGENGLKVYLMCEIPSNVIEAEELDFDHHEECEEPHLCTTSQFNRDNNVGKVNANLEYPSPVADST